MKGILITSIALLLSLSAHGLDNAAESALMNWLETADSALYPESWDQSAAYFQAKVTQADWITAPNNMRKPLGDLKSLSGAPDAETPFLL